ncbi:NADP-dependent malic enzyme [hydrothermal vent metagenome]|uniref:NADP-dependent malic enzyme n=1 Tax=hydrothermal vent metagenome TaxID=652676 RepID=A0A3B0RPB4_9ZZZZ
MGSRKQDISDKEALDFHRFPQPGKIAIAATKPMATQRDLSLAYSPGVAVPVQAIADNPDSVYDYTSKGNMVAVVSNGTAILGMGNLGPAASKPVMEGKSVLFKRFADVDSVDIEIEETEVEAFVECVRRFGNTFGGINLEDIKSPECFLIESQLRDALDIPVFHDDQHGTAIIATAALINAAELTGRKMQDIKVVLVGAGAAGLSVLELIQSLGVTKENTIIVDIDGVVHDGRDDLDQWKQRHAIKTDLRTLEQAMVGADCVLGLSAGGVLSQDMIKSMAKDPIIFAMANPTPEITPEEVHAVRRDAIMATGRSDYPNQVNNVLGFPYIFRGALDVRARTINEDMKIACARALAELAREDVPDEVAAAYHGARPSFGREYIIPAPFDPRLIWFIPPYVAQTAMDTGVARKPIADMDAYRDRLAQRLDPTAALIQTIHSAVRRNPKTVVFAEGEEPSVIRAAQAYQAQGFGKAILVGRERPIKRNMKLVGMDENTDLEICNARLSDRNPDYFDYLYERLQRRGYLSRDVQRLVNNDRNIFSACMLALGDADAMITGVTRNFDIAFRDILRTIDPAPNRKVIGMSIVLSKGQTVFIADTNVTEFPNPDDLADIAIEAARTVRHLGFDPRVAFLSYSNFGNPAGERSENVRRAVQKLDERGDLDFEYEGEMAADVALDANALAMYPFARLSGPANVLIMPAVHSASISTKLLSSIGETTVIGPLLTGLAKPVQICPLGANVSDIVNMASFASYAAGIEVQTS